MSKIRALENFSGLISMGRGQVMECDNEVVLQDLLKAGYIEEIKPEPEETEAETKKAKGADSRETKRNNKK